MPLNLQTKLLRALQEQEFYRLGGLESKKVDLRIISTTNRNIKQAIKEEKFRKDLYYRLVHRTIEIPPLRERKEDISALINYFTAKFCKISERSIDGYTVQSFNALQNYQWDGNVRELENEVRSLINLAEDGETISYDMLSDDIKKQYESIEKPITEPASTEEKKKFI